MELKHLSINEGMISELTFLVVLRDDWNIGNDVAQVVLTAIYRCAKHKARISAERETTVRGKAEVTTVGWDMSRQS
jgi:hypothetical protein